MNHQASHKSYEHESNHGHRGDRCAHDPVRSAGTRSTTAAASDLAHRAARKAAAVGGALSIAPGLLGLATIPVQLAKVWAIQRNLVLEIGALHGVRIELTSARAATGLLRIGGVHVLRVGAASALARGLQHGMASGLMRGAGSRLSLRILSMTALRWVPIAGSAVAALLAHRDTLQVADAAVRLCTELQAKRQ